MWRTITGSLLVLAVAACMPLGAANLPKAPVGVGGDVLILSEAVLLNPKDPAQNRIGDFVYAGGISMTSEQTARLHGLSDMHIGADRRLTAISDEGDLLSARIVLDAKGRLTGVTGAKVQALPGPDGKPLPGKLEADAEGLALMPNGDKLVSFEQRHRIWLYPADGGPPREAPFPNAGFPANGGMEALTPDPASGADAYLTGGEESGQTWICRLSAGCTASVVVAKPPEFGLVAVTRLSDGNTAYLLRAWDPVQGARSTLTIIAPDGATEVARLELKRPLTADNFEGIAALPIPGGQRIYLISDDNFQSIQRTMLLAFDWKPNRGKARP